MKMSYYPDTDSLYIDLSSHPSEASHEVSEGIVLDYDSEGRFTGIDIDNASHKIDLKEITLSRAPRMAISPSRAASWTSNRWATLAQARSSTKATAPESTRRAGRAAPATCRSSAPTAKLISFMPQTSRGEAACDRSGFP